MNQNIARTATQLKDKYGFESPFKPDPLVKKAQIYFRNIKKVLDLGCGEGADSVYFAKKVFEVDAVDNNDDYLNCLRLFLNDHPWLRISIKNSDAIRYPYPQNYYDIVSCLLVGCCMRRSEFERMLLAIKQTVKPKGLIIMSLRNYLDCELKEYITSGDKIEQNTYSDKEDCCKIRYFIEKDRLKKLFADYDILYYYEGLVQDKYLEVPEHGDSYIICRKLK